MHAFFRLASLFLLFIMSACALQPSVQEEGPRMAVDTPYTIDLTQDPDDIWTRIRRGFAIPNLNSPLVDEWTDYYARNAGSVLTMSKRASKYLYFIVDQLEQRGMPTELALLPFVESAFNPTAYSRSHASGLWQFIPSTGKHYNLRQDSWLDERRDPVASTHAALDYLDYLFDYQGDWFLALASYNWGEGAVRRAIEKNEALGLNTDYLSLKMPNETRNYVPKLQAIKNIISNPTAYQIALPNINNEPYFTIVRGPSHMDIEVAARLADMSIDEFTFLNPAYQRDIIPKDRPLILLPKDKAAIFEANLTNYRGRLSRWETYEPIPGESYADIAKKFNMSLSELRNINGARSTEQRPNGNQVLLVAAQEENAHSLVNTHIDSLGVQVASLEDLAVFQQQVQLENPKKIKAITTKNQNTPSPAKEKTGQVRATLEAVNDIAIQRQQRHQARNNEQHPTKTTPSPEQKQHIIQRGDTLYGLARQYSTSVQAIKKLNNLRSHTLPLGKRLFIPS